MKFKTLLILVFTLMAFSCSSDDDKTLLPEEENNAPTIAPDQIFQVPENKIPGVNLGVVEADDEDEGDSLFFSIDGKQGPFVINSSSGALGLGEGQSLDYDYKSTYTLTISVTDGTDTVTETITINVTNINQAPTISAQSFEVFEDFSSTDAFGTLDFENPDGDELTFEITVNDNNMFAVNNNGELFLANGASLDYETATSHEITIEVSDGTATDQDVITIEVQNVIDAPYALEKSSFVITFETDPESKIVGFGTYVNLEHNYVVDWGDGTIEEINEGLSLKTHEYAAHGMHTVAINGVIPAVTFYNNPYATKLASIEQWGTIQWKTLQNAFRGCSNMTSNAIDTPNLSNVISLEGTFYQAHSFNGDISNWDVSNVSNMFSMFLGAYSFNQDISNWDVRNVTSMGYMFSGASAFDQNLGSWEITGLNQGASMEKMLDNSGLSMENYEATLIGWAAWGDALQSNVSLGATGLLQCSEESDEAKDFLVNTKAWVIDDNGCNQ